MEIKAYFRTEGSLQSYGTRMAGDWVIFPIEEDALIEKFKEIGKDMPKYSQFMFHVTHWDVPNFILDELKDSKIFDLRKINQTAEYLKDIKQEDAPVVKALLDADYDLEDACRIVVNGDYDDLRNQSDEDIIRDFLDDNYDVPDYILDNVDWSDVADDFFDEEDGFVYVNTGDTHGYIRVTE